MKIYCCQHHITWEDKEANFAHVENLVRKASPARFSLVLLPEMFATGFTMNVDAAAQSAKQETEAFLCYLAKALEVYLMGGVVNRGPDGRARNQAVVYSPEGEKLTTYTKIQPFTLGGEARHYAAGSEPTTFQWESAIVAPYICYDLRFPEVVRPAALAGAHVLTFIASWPGKRIHHWVKLAQARAIENQCYVAAVNRLGDDPFHHHPGRSLIVDYTGEIIADAGSEETIISAPVNLGELREYREGLPFLADIRPDFVPGGNLRL